MLDLGIRRLLDAYPAIFLACHRQHVREDEAGKAITEHQASVLDHLHATRPTTLSKLAEHMGVGRSAMSITAKRLVRGGYVRSTRDKNDARCVGLTLTPAGARVKEQNAVLDPELVKKMFRLMIHHHNGPRVPCARAPRLPCALRRGSGIIRRERLPFPAQRTGARVKGSNHATRHLCARIVVNGRADHDDVVDHRRRRSHVILPWNITRDIAQADLSAIAEIHARLARRTIQRDEPRIQSSFENSPTAGFPFHTRWIKPRCNTTIDQPIAVVSGELNHRIVDPALLSCFRIDCKNTIEPGGKVKRSIHEDRRCFQAAALLAAVAVGNIAHMKGPGDHVRGLCPQSHTHPDFVCSLCRRVRRDTVDANSRNPLSSSELRTEDSAKQLRSPRILVRSAEHPRQGPGELEAAGPE